MTEYDTIEFEVRGHTACVTLNRPEVLNAINDEMIAELAEVYAEIERSQDIWTVIITGAGRALCVGADVNKAADHDMENAAGIDNQGEPILSSMRQWDAPQEATPPWLQMTKPIICAVNGIACGAGMDLVTTADITDRLRACDADGSAREHRGFVGSRSRSTGPDPAASRRHAAGADGQARDGWTRSAPTTWASSPRWSPHDSLMARAWEIADVVNSNAPLAVRGSRMAVRKGLTLPIYEAELLAENYRMKVALTKDAIEGPRAFLEKRKPEWKAL